MKIIFTVALLSIFAASAQAKPSYSFGDEPRRCKTNSDCAIIMVDCHGCGWADSVNNASLKASEKIVKDYCEGWKKQKEREPNCEKPVPFSKREAVCSAKICEARTYP